MKKQSPWLFETPPVLKPNPFSNLYFEPFFWSNTFSSEDDEAYESYSYGEKPNRWEVESVENELSPISKGLIYAQIGLVIATGERDVNKLTNAGFFALHPERNGASISPSEPNAKQLIAEWKEIRDTIIKPFLDKISSGKKPDSGKAGPLDLVMTSMPAGAYYKLSGTQYKYGTPKTIEALQWIAQEWHRLHPEVTFMVRDISRLGGGKIFKENGKLLHKSHRIGLDADVQLLVDGQKICMENSHYKSWRPLIQELVDVIAKNPKLEIGTIGFSDRQIENERVKYWQGHTCHLHIRFCMPDEYKSYLDLGRVYDKHEERAPYKRCSKSSEFELGKNNLYLQLPSIEHELSPISKGFVYVQIGLAIANGERNINNLTNVGFFALHPERNGTPVSKSELNFEQLRAEWKEIRDTIVKPFLNTLFIYQPSSPSTQRGAFSCIKSTKEHLRRLAQAVENMGTLPGFAKFAEGAAWSESRWDNCQVNEKPNEKQRALNGFKKAREKGWYSKTSYTEDDFGFGTGGWFGLMPSSALVAGGSKGPFINSNPRLVHDPAASVTMLADMVFRLVKRHKALDWLAVRRGMKSVDLVHNYKDSQGVQNRFYQGLSAAGVTNPETFMRQSVDISSYPGAQAIYEKLRIIL